MACLPLFDAVESRSDLLSCLNGRELDVVTALLRVAAYRDRWIRPIEVWQTDRSKSAKEQWGSLLRHLFAKYPVPEMLDAAWLTYGPLEHVERDWYVHVAAGGSFATAPCFPKSVNSRAVHCALTHPQRLPLRLNLRRGQFMAMRAAEAVQRAVMHRPMAVDFSNDEVWVRLISKMSDYAKTDEALAGLLLDTFNVVLSLQGVDRCAQLLRLPMTDLIRHGQGLWTGWRQCLEAEGATDLSERQVLEHTGDRERIRQLMVLRWVALDGVVPFLHKSGSLRNQKVWRVLELRSALALEEEAREMRHCVRSYGKKCRRGMLSLFSLRCRHAQSLEQERFCLTIAVNRSLRTVVEARGRWNMRPDSEIAALLKMWCALQGFKIGKAVRIDGV